MATLQTILSENREISKEVIPTLLVCVDNAGVPQVPKLDAGGQLIVAAGTVALNIVDSFRLEYSGTNVTTAAWVQLLAATSADIKKLDIFDSSGQTLQIGIGAGGAEVAIGYVFPGGCVLESAIPSGTRIAIKAVTATANVGYINVNAVG